MAGLLSVRAVGGRSAYGGGPTATLRPPCRTRPDAAGGAAGRAPHVLLACGRAPGRALWPGRRGSASMGAAWVGPLHWTQWAGGHRRLIPRRRRTGPGGEPRLPDCAFGGPPERTGADVRAGGEPVRERQRVVAEPAGRPRIKAGWNGTSCAPENGSGTCRSLREWPNGVGPSRLGGRFADTRRAAGLRSAGSSGGGRISAGTTRGQRGRQQAEPVGPLRRPPACGDRPAPGRPPAFARGACACDVRPP